MNVDVSADRVFDDATAPLSCTEISSLFTPHIKQNVFLDLCGRSFSFFITVLKRICDTADTADYFSINSCLIYYSFGQDLVFTKHLYVKQPTKQRAIQL